MATTNTPQQKPKILLRAGRQNEPLRVPIVDLTVDSINTFLTADNASALTTLTVKNITGFAINQVLLIGTAGNQGSEIIKTSASVAPTGSTITLATATAYPHSAGTPILVINFDQVEFSYAATLAGSKSVLATSNIVANSTETTYNDIVNTTGFYFARFKNTITTTFSPYSDGVPVLGYGPLTARSIIDNALQSINKKISDVLTDEYGFNQLNNCTTEVIRELKRWSFLQKFNSKVGTVTTVTWRLALPTDLDDQNTNKSIYNARIGIDLDLIWVDKEKWDDLTSGLANTTLAVAISIGNATVTLTDSSNFPDAGSFYCGANTYSYTANNRTTNILTLSVVSATSNLINADVFTGGSIGMPRYWTTFGGYIYFYPIADSNHNNRSLFMDYYVAITPIYSDTDIIVFPDPTVAQYYLAWKFLLKIQNGVEAEGSLAQKDSFIKRLAVMKNKETMNRTFHWKPLLNKINESNDTDGRKVRTGNFSNTAF